MTAILRSLAEAYPQQVLVVLRTQVAPALITDRLHRGECLRHAISGVERDAEISVQSDLPLIADWTARAPPLDGYEDAKAAPVASAAATIGESDAKPPAIAESGDADAKPTEKAAALNGLRVNGDEAMEVEAVELAADASWIEKALSVVEAMCLQRCADVCALNTILNELDAWSLSWTERVHAELVSELASCVHRLAERRGAFRSLTAHAHCSDADALVAAAADNATAAAACCSSQLVSTLAQFCDAHLAASSNNDEIATRRKMREEAAALAARGWPLLSTAIFVCEWAAALEEQLCHVDE